MASAAGFINLVLFYTSIVAVAVATTGSQFEVGDKKGWKKPSGNDPETYNEWAGRHRFRVGDSIHFRYKKDSVMEVTAADYSTCNTSNPKLKFDDGDTAFEFDRPGSFYFISGQESHCEAGQKLIVSVMHTSDEHMPVLGPVSDHPKTNSVGELLTISELISSFVGAFFIMIVV